MKPMKLPEPEPESESKKPKSKQCKFCLATEIHTNTCLRPGGPNAPFINENKFLVMDVNQQCSMDVLREYLNRKRLKL